MTITIQTNAPEVRRAFVALYADQFPFAIAKALTDTARGIVQVQQEGMQERFTIRRQWVLKGVRMTKRAEKWDGEAHVSLDQTRHFLVRFEDGGTMRPERASRFSVPKDARRTKTGVVQRGQKPKSLNFRSWGSGPEATVYVGDKRTFMIRRNDGTGAVVQRRGRGSASNVKTLFTFSPTARLDALLRFYPTAELVYGEMFPENFQAALDRAIRTAR